MFMSIHRELDGDQGRGDNSGDGGKGGKGSGHPNGSNGSNDHEPPQTAVPVIAPSVVGPIVGGTIGGVAGLLIVFTGLLLCWRRRKRQRRERNAQSIGYNAYGYDPSGNTVLSSVFLPPNTLSSTFSAAPSRAPTMSHNPLSPVLPIYGPSSHVAFALPREPPTALSCPMEKSSRRPRTTLLFHKDSPRPLSSGIPHEDLTKATTLLNRVVARLALTGVNKPPLPHDV